MARADASHATRSASSRATRGGHPWLQGLACGALLAFAPGFALLLAALLAPAFVGLLLDRRPGRPIARAILLAGAAFSLAPAWHLFQGGQNVAAAMDLLVDPAILAPAWLAGSCGWAICEILPVLLRVAADVRATTRIAALQAEVRALRETWDLEKG
jgi:hypothetical protein